MEGKRQINRGDVGIIGGGIAGLTLAHVLHQKGIPFRLFERTGGIETAGAGIIIPPNAVEIFRRLGIDGDVKAKGIELDSMNILDRSGKPINAISRDFYDRFTRFRPVAIARRDLHELLFRLLMERIGSEPPITFGKKFISSEIGKDRVIARFEDGSSESFDLLVGADGLRSRLRNEMIGDSLRSSGQFCYRGIASVEGAVASNLYEFWNGAGRFGYVPIGAGRVYWYATVPLARSSHRFERDTDFLIDCFGELDPIVSGLVTKTGDPNIIRGELADRKPLRGWSGRATVLIGDAAHPTTPNLGQGAAMGIESAFVLGESLAKHQNLRDALRRFERIRFSRTKMVTDRSWTLGKVSHIENRILASLRNGMMSHTPDFAVRRSLRRVVTFPEPA